MLQLQDQGIQDIKALRKHPYFIDFPVTRSMIRNLTLASASQRNNTDLLTCVTGQ